MFCLPFLYLYFYCGLLFPLSRPMCFLWHKCNEEMCNRIIGISPKTRNCQRFFDTGSRPLLFEMSAFHIKSNEHLSTVILVPHFPVGDSECPNTQDTWISVPDFIAGLFDPNLFFVLPPFMLLYCHKTTPSDNAPFFCQWDKIWSGGHWSLPPSHCQCFYVSVHPTGLYPYVEL